ncbi:hypothetical protein PROFUN_06172 [Planoprotostelium fungivorum]|uniref:CTLH domain-containing protein n=1 Tax=Planoprotostelium fungivorum TaxID=1890364 RepID=A0A2P6NPS3_9EUKA|nr:hypothetical protein PROFUN_06172 [Planoprotostelium fungivorum]
MEELIVRLMARNNSYQESSSTHSAAPPTLRFQEKQEVSIDNWMNKLKDADVSRQHLNQLIMNYFMIEGYKEAAQNFQQESAAVDLETISERVNIRNLMESGRVEEAVECTNDMNPEILDTNSALFFHIQQQRLIELIRENRTMDALQFAQQQLAAQGEENPEFLEELEKTMALLAFDDHTSTPLSHLMSLRQRIKIASELNAAILLSQKQDKDPKLPFLIKMTKWSQETLGDKHGRM